MDKAAPDVWRPAHAYSASVLQTASVGGLKRTETDPIKVRSSQLNGCAFCLDLHSREARAAWIPQQTLDLLPARREAKLLTERGDDAFVAAQWMAVTINTVNRISILSEHPVQPRDADERLVR